MNSILGLLSLPFCFFFFLTASAASILLMWKGTGQVSTGWSRNLTSEKPVKPLKA